jgi:hypothetical protein
MGPADRRSSPRVWHAAKRAEAGNASSILEPTVPNLCLRSAPFCVSLEINLFIIYAQFLAVLRRVAVPPVPKPSADLRLFMSAESAVNTCQRFLSHASCTKSPPVDDRFINSK